MTESQGTPTIRDLDRAECDALLARHHVGRLAFTFRDRVDIAPIHYVFAQGRIYGRTGFGAKVEVLEHHPWVAFEVDEVDALFTWRSVVVHGRVIFPDPSGAPQDQQSFLDGVEAFRQLVPDAFAEGDPTPDRVRVFMIHVHDVAGRSATTADDGRTS